MLMLSSISIKVQKQPMIVTKLKYISCYIHEIAKLIVTFPDTLLKTGASIPNQHSVVLTIYDSVTSIGNVL